MPPDRTHSTGRRSGLMGRIRGTTSSAVPPRMPMPGPQRASRSPEEKSMSRLSLFNSPLLLGFEPFERALDRVSKISSDGYPPYNIEQLGENELRITLAVAGF